MQLCKLIALFRYSDSLLVNVSYYAGIMLDAFSYVPTVVLCSKLRMLP